MAPTANGYPPEEGVDGEAYVYVLAKPPSTPSAPTDETVFPTSTLYGPGVYQVDPSATGRHNLRSAPRVGGLAVGTLLGGDVVDVAKVVTVRVPGANGATVGREHWAQLSRASAGPPLWTLLASSSGQLFLRFVGRRAASQGVAADPQAQSRREVSDLDRAIAERLGNPDSDDAEIDALIERLTAHELETAVEKAAANRMEISFEEASNKTKDIKAENLAKQFQEQTMKAAQAKRREQRETWELQRPQVGVKRMQRMAALDASLSAHEAECKDRLRQLREKRLAESLADSALEPVTFAAEAQKSSGKLDVVNMEELQESAAKSEKTARDTASEAARSLAGVSDTSLAEALVKMEAATALSYRKLAYES